jgi:hypothetical protein
MASPTFSALYTRWHSGGRKRMPKDLVLTPISSLFLHLGDGGVAGNRINLSLHDFPMEDILNIFIPQVEKVTGVLGGAVVYGGIPRVYLRPLCAHKWLEFLGPCPVPSKEYRWELTNDPLPFLRERALSEDELIQMVRWKLRGAKPTEIANRLGRKRNTIISALQRMKRHAEMD